MADVVKLLSTSDCEAFHALHARACGEEPQAFLKTREEVLGKSKAELPKYFDNGWISGAYVDQKLVGISGVFRHRGQKVQHRGTLWGVYVAPEARGRGIAARLIACLETEAKNAGIEQIELSSAPGTQSVYERLGFTPCGTSKRILKLAENDYIDDTLMIKFLS